MILSVETDIRDLLKLLCITFFMHEEYKRKKLDLIVNEIPLEIAEFSLPYSIRVTDNEGV